MKIGINKRAFSEVRRFLNVMVATLAFATLAFGQADQGGITGTIVDPQHQAVAKAHVRATNLSTGLVLNADTDDRGVYLFAPINAGHYRVTATLEGFSISKTDDLLVSVNQRTTANFTLSLGVNTQSVTVTASIINQEDATVDQSFSEHFVQEVPLATRNYVYLAQLSPGVGLPNIGARGTNSGDFSANGQRTEQNNFILDGVDNNSNLVDFLNGASYGVKPPLEALQEFKVETSNYSAELGHSAGAVVNASIKSGTNSFHGALWEYLRNEIFNAQQRFAVTLPEYRQNQFGATFGGPFLKNHLFFFADTEVSRVLFGETGSYAAPTVKMRTGDFSELLNTSLTGVTYKRLLYEPGSGGATALQCNGQQNVICPNRLSPMAKTLLNLFPLPNTGAVGRTTNNNLFQNTAADNSTHYDVRLDWNPSSRNQAFGRYSYSNNPKNFPPPLGILDGGSYGSTGQIANEGRNLVLSDTHFFSFIFSNELRFAYNWLHVEQNQVSSGEDLSAQYGLGGIPFTPGQGGFPVFSVSNLSAFGNPSYYATVEGENVAQLLDNVTYQAKNHTLKFGINFERIRYLALSIPEPRGFYSVTGKFTESIASTSTTGFGTADFLLDQIASSAINNVAAAHEQHWYRAAFFQDDWKATPKLTLNLGLRYEYFQPEDELDGRQANFVPDYVNHAGTYYIPEKSRDIPIPPSAQKIFQASNISLVYTNNNSLVLTQKFNFAPRIGLPTALQIVPSFVAASVSSTEVWRAPASARIRD
jgi:hypothetical protein